MPPEKQEQMYTTKSSMEQVKISPFYYILQHKRTSLFKATTKCFIVYE